MTREKMEKILAERYGIHSEKELMDAYRKMPKIDIAIFTHPIPEHNRGNRSTADERADTGRSKAATV